MTTAEEMEELRGAIAEAQRANAPDWDKALLRLAWRARRSVSAPSAPTPASCAPASSAPATVPAGIARPDLSPAESRWHPGPARRGSEPDADRSDTEERCSETAVWKEREPTVWKETTIDESRSTDERRSSDEGRSSNKGGTSNKPTAKARTPNKPSAEATTAEAATAEATTTKSRLGRSRDQRSANYDRCRESGEFLVHHGAASSLDNSPLPLTT
jgi:hypothetical protein